MLIEIYGAGFANKGAQLMLETVVERCRQVSPDVQFAIESGPDRPPTKVHRLGVQLLFPSGAFCGPRKNLKYYVSNILSRLTAWKKVRAYGVVSRCDVDALINISGYAFGDFWGSGSAARFLPLAKFYRQRGKPVIMLPQMLGPFENQELRELFREMATTVTMIHARERASLKCATDASPDANILLAPDITISTIDHGPKPEMNPNRVCIIPNVRVTDNGSQPMEEAVYLELLKRSAEQVLDAGKEVVVVVHEYFGQDAILAEKLQALLKEEGHEVQLVAESDPKKLKSFLGASRFVIGSRFHSIVAALSYGVPCVVIGWAHKYRELLADFGQEKFDISDSRSHDAMEPLVKELLDAQGHESNRRKIETAAEEMKVKNEAMWASVFETLGLVEETPTAAL